MSLKAAGPQTNPEVDIFLHGQKLPWCGWLFLRVEYHLSHSQGLILRVLEIFVRLPLRTCRPAGFPQQAPNEQGTPGIRRRFLKSCTVSHVSLLAAGYPLAVRRAAALRFAIWTFGVPAALGPQP